jgi:hypothetical protein
MSAGIRVATGVWIDLWKLWIGPILLRRPNPAIGTACHIAPWCSVLRGVVVAGRCGCGALWLRGVVVAGPKGSRVIRIVRN